MRIHLKSLGWDIPVLVFLLPIALGLLASDVFSQQSEPATSSEPPKALPIKLDTEIKSVGSEKAGSDKKMDQKVDKPLTRRPDPRKPTTTQNSEPKSERQLAAERKARDAARKNGEITFDDLKFDIEKDAEFKAEMITKELKELDKKTVKLRGFILPTSVFQQSGIKQFVLVRDNQECCFGPGAAIYDCVIVDMLPGKTTNFATRVVTVKGKFEIDTESYQYPDDGGHYAIFKMTAEEVK